MTENFSSSRSAKAAVALLLGINLFNYIDRYILSAVEPQIRATFFSPTDPNAMAKVGSLATAFLLSYMLLAPIFGWLADRISRWWLIAISVALWSLASGASGLAATFAILMLTRVFVGVGEAGYGPAAPTILADLFPIQRRGKVMAYFFAAIPFGSALGYVFGGTISAHFGSWRWPFYLVAIPGILLACCCPFMRDPRPKKPRPALFANGEGKRFSIAPYVRLFKNRSYFLNCVAMTAMTFAIGGLSFWVPDYIYNYRHEGSLAHVNLVFGGITAITGIIATLLGGMVGDRLTKRFPSAYFSVSGVSMALAFPFAVGFLYTPFPLAWGFLAAAIFFIFFNTAPSNTAIANVTPPAIRASAYAMNILMIHLFGDAISPPLIGWIAGHTNENIAFLTISATILLAGVVWLFAARFLAADVARVEGV